MNDPYCRSFPHAEKDTTHLDELKTVALAFGYSPEDIDLLAAQGFTCLLYTSCGAAASAEVRAMHEHRAHLRASCFLTGTQDRFMVDV